MNSTIDNVGVSAVSMPWTLRAQSEVPAAHPAQRIAAAAAAAPRKRRAAGTIAASVRGYSSY